MVALGRAVLAHRLFAAGRGGRRDQQVLDTCTKTLDTPFVQLGKSRRAKGSPSLARLAFWALISDDLIHASGGTSC